MQNRETILPFITATICILLILLALINSEITGYKTILLTSFIIWLVWLFFYILKTHMKKDVNSKIIKQPRLAQFTNIFICLIISLFLVNKIWFSGYLTLNPDISIIQGTIHRDTLHLSSITESIKNYGYPGNIASNFDYYHYHSGSNYIIALLSMMLRIPVFNVYNFLVPIICLPAFMFLIVLVIIEIRKFRKYDQEWSTFDYMFLAFFLVGFLPEKWLENLGIWKGSVIISESYLFGQIFFLIYLYLIFKINNDNKFLKCKQLIIFISTPIFIFLCSWMKISVGFLLFAGTGYYFFRKYTKTLRYWLLNILCLFVFVVAYLLFNNEFSNDTQYTANHLFDGFQFLAFARKYAGQLFLWHYVVLLFFSMLFICYNLSKSKLLINDLNSKKIIFEETVIVVVIVSQLPGMFFNIRGGSAAYFSYFQELISIVFLLGFNVVNEMIESLKKREILKPYLAVFFLLFVSTIMFNSKLINCFIKEVSVRFENSSYSNENAITENLTRKNIGKVITNGLYTIFSKNTYLDYSVLVNVNQLASISISQKKYYAIYLERSAEIWQYFMHRRDYGHREQIPVLFYPALTGLHLINGTENELHLSSLTLERALEKAKKRDVRYLVRIYDSTYEIINIVDELTN